MSRKRFNNFNCSIAQSLDQIGDWWTILVIREAFCGVHSFSGFQVQLGIARNILTDRLDRLVADNILLKAPDANDQRRVDYALTPKGEALFPLLIVLLQWGDKWAHPAQGAPVKLIEKSSGDPVPEIGVTSSTGRCLNMRDVQIIPGPGAKPATIARFKPPVTV